ncbi:MAG: YbgC/FadM family acyl-CoA thioesterase [Epsilonproteobacteria bacterium]|jgi:acyl-CoA thioester hydrolase|uniref:YbgC/FadM family acyl-CoA thioesterase n=1 Tax=Sulfurospirillum TaxID=57665 RepID=UPI0005442ED7|nr:MULTISPECIES: YbgC/FadM family acyl-CoA thioesterase [Sulfurospirillum]NCB55493.1 YbgC/FadM family acyl-CoA thioesterase [Campylobacterota bacterium]KHG33517.1 MAG: acyl-CoA thioester hydrolase [Sulfurospirillum sp. MES]MCD8545432.1 YbgC/FadM family acyl-CoA thioesterase [Sulfurospirillum cavolei]MCP3651460.1 YbgC/FadM family acyl-CoA thioesterase [Sulfurospirillum sp. DNRA8]MCR1810307.1 YbgC/FadM family acyl-CoA thioesterase [Sulfurospirillum sp. DNRA8]
MKTRIYYDDTDAGGVVYHANYLTLCERARSDLFYERGMSPAVNGGHFVVKHLEADYLKSAKLGDLIEVKSELVELKNASLVLKQTIYKEEAVLFRMVATLAYVKEGKPSRIDEDTKAFFLSLKA